jgi:hypothetical protein
MPMKSQAERRWLWANKPETPKGAKLPEHVKRPKPARKR